MIKSLLLHAGIASLVLASFAQATQPASLEERLKDHEERLQKIEDALQTVTRAACAKCAVSCNCNVSCPCNKQNQKQNQPQCATCSGGCNQCPKKSVTE